MTDEALCTLYELIIAMLEDGKTDKVIEILKKAIKRLENN